MTEKSKLKQIHPEKYREFGLTVGLCACVQENAGIPERSCDCCYGTGISVYTHIDIPAPTNCPHWINDQIYVKGFRCALYRDVGRDIRDTTIRKEERERVLDELEKMINTSPLRALIGLGAFDNGANSGFDIIIEWIKFLRKGAP